MGSMYVADSEKWMFVEGSDNVLSFIKSLLQQSENWVCQEKHKSWMQSKKFTWEKGEEIGKTIYRCIMKWAEYKSDWLLWKKIIEREGLTETMNWTELRNKYMKK